jgi:CubicO group peptidase (beta-lactamase class C family)
MRAGISFDEDYLATSGPIVAYRKAVNWNPLEPGDTVSDLRSFYRELTNSSGPHGGPFNYVSRNTDLLGWVIERATGERYADLMSELLWKPVAAVRSAYITVDRLGAPRSAGGVCTTVRDLARVGQLMVEGGARGTTEIVPASWIDDIARNGDADAWAPGNGARYFPGLAIRYRSKWYVLDGEATNPNALLCMAWKWQRGDVSRHTGGDLKAALGHIKAKTFVMPIDEDMFFPPRDCEAEQRMIPGSQFRPIKSIDGHLALFGTDPDAIGQLDRHLKDLLEIRA